MNPDERNGIEAISLQKYADVEQQFVECIVFSVRAMVHGQILATRLCIQPSLLISFEKVRLI